MTVRVADYAGFCMGVSRAVDAAEALCGAEAEVVSLGELIHNPQEVQRLSRLGLRVIHDAGEATGTVLIRSHGVSRAELESLQARSADVRDLTCPFVERLHRIVADNSLPDVILVGEKDHPEVQGTAGWCRGTVHFVADESDALVLPKLDAALAVAQTTYPPEKWESVLRVLKTRVRNLTWQDTICGATRQRQNAARALAAQADCMIVVGGRQSANTRKLYDVCRAVCPRTILVERAAEIPPAFANISDFIGITAGASTPQWLLKEVVTHMNDMERNAQELTQEQDSFAAAFEKTLVRIKPGQTMTGTVIQITDDEVCVNIGYKSDGLVNKSEMVDENVQVGDEIEVEVVKVNDGEGNVILSQKNIVNRKVWDELMAKYEDGECVDGVGKEAVKGGLIALIDGIRAFVPASHLASHYVEKIDEFVGKEMRLKMIEVDTTKKRIVASRKVAMKEENESRKAAAWEKLEEGAIVKGIVRRLTDFGAFVDLGGVDGLIHVTDLSWGRVKHPGDVVAPNQEVEVKIMSLDKERERIQLSLKALQPKPWDVATEKYPVGSVVEGKVVRIQPFGAFVELEAGLDGLVHISQCALTRVAKVEDAVQVGQVIRVKVLAVDPEAKRISLSIREVLEDEALTIEEIPGEELVEETAAPVEE